MKKAWNGNRVKSSFSHKNPSSPTPTVERSTDLLTPLKTHHEFKIANLPMRHFQSLDGVYCKNTWLTIGSFDGVHRGHQYIIQNMIHGARQAGSQVVVLSFFPHPAVVLRNLQGPFYLTSPEEKIPIFERLGVDVTITHPFNHEIAAMSAGDFMTYLQRHLDISQLWVGHDFALGKGREGNVLKLSEIGRESGFTVQKIQPIEFDQIIISSSQIRTSLAEGDMTMVEQMLGRPYQVSGKVVPGDGRGRLLGIPTANLEIWPDKLLPKTGVYACRARVADQTWGAVTNIGVRPTFDQQGTYIHVEAHLLKFAGDLYNQKMHLDIISRLRDEQRFTNVQALVNQIQQDILIADNILGQPKIQKQG